MTETEVEAIACHAVGTTEKALRLLIQENAKLKARIAELEALVLSQADRIHKQSELLSKKSEKP